MMRAASSDASSATAWSAAVGAAVPAGSTEPVDASGARCAGGLRRTALTGDDLGPTGHHHHADQHDDTDENDAKKHHDERLEET